MSFHVYWQRDGDEAPASKQNFGSRIEAETWIGIARLTEGGIEDVAFDIREECFDYSPCTHQGVLEGEACEECGWKVTCMTVVMPRCNDGSVDHTFSMDDRTLERPEGREIDWQVDYMRFPVKCEDCGLCARELWSMSEGYETEDGQALQEENDNDEAERGDLL